jgi:mannose-6-phosphate isomerase-like protein (cupin superfamily)
MRLFDNKLKISSKNNAVVLEWTGGKRAGERLQFDHASGAKFASDTGEMITEYSGVATDKREDRSWARALFKPAGHSSRHHHTKGVETYYIVNGSLKIEIDGSTRTYHAGEKVKIPAGKIHQVTNPTKSDAALLVKCKPSWTFEDSHDDPSPRKPSRCSIL